MVIVDGTPKRAIQPEVNIRATVSAVMSGIGKASGSVWFVVGGNVKFATFHKVSEVLYRQVYCKEFAIESPVTCFCRSELL